jgi:arylsulfatase A-like enzyme
MRWLERHAGDRFFLWIHNMDTHHPPTVDNPYLFLPEWKGYIGEVRWVDESVGRLFAKLRQLGIWDECAVIFTADHGEAFGEHKMGGHQDVMYDEVLRVPLIISLPGVARPRRVADPVELVDLFGTILDIAGVPVPAQTRSESLYTFVDGERPRRTKRYVFHSRYHFEDAHHKLAVRDREWKLIVSTPDQNPVQADTKDARERQAPQWRLDAPGTALELYNLQDDPGEKQNLWEKQPEVARRLLSVLDTWQTTVAAETGTIEPPPELDQATKDALKALGYD